MAALTHYLENKMIDQLLRGTAYTFPTTGYIGLITATKGYWTASTAYSVGDFVLPTTPNGHMYECTTAGTSASTEPTWPTTNDGTVTDGTVTWTECYSVLKSGTWTEASGGSYARVSIAASLTDWAGTQGAGSTTVSSGTSGTTSNNIAITWPQATTAEGLQFGFAYYDASTSGNPLLFGVLTTPQSIGINATASFAAASLTFQIDN